jgi:hypothetical protein
MSIGFVEIAILMLRRHVSADNRMSIATANKAASRHSRLRSRPPVQFFEEAAGEVTLAASTSSRDMVMAQRPRHECFFVSTVVAAMSPKPRAVSWSPAGDADRRQAGDFAF